MHLLAALIARHAHTDGVHPTAIPGVWVIRASQPTEPLHVLHVPALCIVASGRKQVTLGDLSYDYDAAKYLVVSVDLPIGGQVTEATADQPYLCVRIDLDPGMLAAVMMENPVNDPTGDATAIEQSALSRPDHDRGLFVSNTSPALTDAAIRLLRLLDTPDDITYLAPLAQREIFYRLMTGEQGGTIRNIAASESRLHQVNRAIAWIKQHFAKPFSIDMLAAEAHMSPSALHLHFKAVTAMSPLQFQKQLRLQEARRLMVGRALDASRAAYEVGYESASQFTREYSRLFGAPPARDVARLKASPSRFVSA
ncbi:AraC family transcriptional regulator [Pigmentiphaga aceris]|nr:AraC family transcriptional regulator [Pigmentiphaga aceris]